jgi:hypothetical protein
MVSLVALASLVGCASECDERARVDGTYAAWHTFTESAEPGAPTSRDPAWPAYEAFVNGWSRWDLAWSDVGVVTLQITDAAERQGELTDGAPTVQSYTGQMLEGEDNCNRLALSFAGDWDTPSGETLTFTYAADLTFVGDRLNGTFSYADTMASTGAAGVSGVTGQVTAVLQSDDTFDTGFGG